MFAQRWPRLKIMGVLRVGLVAWAVAFWTPRAAAQGNDAAADAAPPAATATTGPAWPEKLTFVDPRLSPYPEGKTTVRRVAGDYSAREASWQRQELSLAFSSDDGQTWTTPVVVARGRAMQYPMIYEAKPGVVWLFAPALQLRAQLREADFVAIAE